MCQSVKFKSVKFFDAGTNAQMIVSADFNGDGLQDLAISNYTGDNISVLIAVKSDSFKSETLYSAGDGAFDIVVSDFNLDKKWDLAVSNYNADNISVFIGKGDGTFYSKVDYAATNGPKGIIADFLNNDTIPDIAVSNDLADKISVYIGKGNGTFYSKVDYTCGDRPHGLLSGLIDKDSIIDLISINRNDDKISVLRGNGNGTFKTKVDFSVTKYPQYASLGDFNGDNLNDIAVCNTFSCDSVSILLGDTGTIFKNAKNYYSGGESFDVSCGDFNLDKKTDLAVTNLDDDSISILLGNGNGTFNKPVKLVTGNAPNGIISLDIDNDSDIDLINVNNLSGGSSSLLINSFCPSISFIKKDASIVGKNDGWATAIITGGLRPYKYLWSDSSKQTDSTAKSLSAGSYTVTVSDSLGCNVKAEVKINNPVCNISINISKTHVSFIGGADGQAKASPMNAKKPYTFLWSDIYNQKDSVAQGLMKGNYQVIVTDSAGCKDTASVVILEMPCISSHNNYSSYGSADIETALINNDSFPDLVILYSVAYSTDKVNILLGKADGTFTFNSSFTVGTGGDQPVDLVVDDFNGDTINDIVIAIPDGVNGISVYLGKGDGTFPTKTNYSIGSRPWHIISHDFDYDGDKDLIICREQGSDVRLVKNNGSGVFSAYSSKTVGSNPMYLASGYLDNDTLPDLVVANQNQANISVLFGTANSSYFSSATNYTVGLSPMEIALGDFNNDNSTDVAVTGNSPDKVYVFFNKGDGTLHQKTEYTGFNKPLDIKAYDMNGDSNIDLMVSNASNNSLSPLLGQGNGIFDTINKISLSSNPNTAIVTDHDRDGDPDYIVTLSNSDSITILSNCFVEKCFFIDVDSIKLPDRTKSNGLISVTITGKNPPFTCQWNDPLKQTTAVADSLPKGTYKLIVSDSTQCLDSIIIQLKEVECELDSTHLQTSICVGDSFLFDGIYRKISGVYFDSLQNVLACDSIVILNLKVYNNSRDTVVLSVCDSFVSPKSKIFKSSGIYPDTLKNFNACDSVVTFYLTVNHSSNVVIFDTVCNSYKAPDGIKTYTNSGKYIDTIPSFKGCDSIITLNLIVNHSSYSVLYLSACDSFTVPSGVKTYKQSGTYQDTIPNYSGCDSIMIINLSIHKTSYSSHDIDACEQFYWNLTGKTYTTSGLYKDTIPNYTGCDSIVSLNLTIKKASSANLNVSACEQYYWNLTGKTYTKSGIYKDTILNYAGCDSIVSLNLIIKKSSSANLNVSACDNYYWNLTGKTYTISGIYKDTILNYAGCDSIVSLNLIIKKSSSANLNVSACDNYYWNLTGKTYTTSGLYKDTIPNYAGCDSVITLNLDVVQIDTAIIINTNVLIAKESGLKYQWLDCENNYATIPAETNQSFTPVKNGSYAVELKKSNCSDTSFCYLINSIGIIKQTFNSFLLYPNPSEGRFLIVFPNEPKSGKILIYNLQSRLLIEHHFNAVKEISIDMQNQKGVYFMQIVSENQEIWIEKIVIY